MKLERSFEQEDTANYATQFENGQLLRRVYTNFLFSFFSVSYCVVLVETSTGGKNSVINENIVLN